MGVLFWSSRLRGCLILVHRRLSHPSEPGQVFLRADEITRAPGLTTRKSKNPGELFSSDLHSTIHEGDWGQYYGARFEVWFDPESGGPERKLLESNWKIEGWMH